MAFTIALAGKGGTGKTTLSALAVRALVRAGAGSVLAVDADPNSTLHEALGATVERTVGEITEDMLAAEGQVSGMSKAEWMDYNIQRYLAEERGYDLLTMGRPEGPGCYCYANNLIRDSVASLARGYDFVVTDNEAGLEHMSRRTARAVDALVLVSDASVRGLRTVARLGALADELGIEVGSRCTIVDRAAEPLDPVLVSEAAVCGLAIAGVVPTDPHVTRADLEGTGLLDAEEDFPAAEAMRRILGEIVPALHGIAGVGSHDEGDRRG